MKLFKREDIDSIEVMARKMAKMGLGDFEKVKFQLIKDIGTIKIKELTNKLQNQLNTLLEV